MLDTKPQPGRPRLYGSASEKVSAFRTRQEKAGYARKELLVTPHTEALVRALALQEGVTPVDVYSAMVEVGLSVTYATQQQGASLCVAHGGAVENTEGLGGAIGHACINNALRTETGLLGQVAAAPEHALPHDNPISRFFQKRKEQLHEK